MHLNAGVNLTTNSVFSTSDPRSVGMRMPGSSLLQGFSGVPATRFL